MPRTAAARNCTIGAEESATRKRLNRLKTVARTGRRGRCAATPQAIGCDAWARQKAGVCGASKGILRQVPDRAASKTALFSGFHNAHKSADPVDLLPVCLAELLEPGDQVFRSLTF